MLELLNNTNVIHTNIENFNKIISRLRLNSAVLITIVKFAPCTENEYIQMFKY